MLKRLLETLQNYARVLKVMKKPSWQRFVTITRVCALGMALLGLIGFIVYLIFVVLG